MKKSPTYSASEIRQMCANFDLDYEVFKTIVDVVDEEIELYTDEELIILTQASFIMFNRSLLKLSLKNIK